MPPWKTAAFVGSRQQGISLGFAMYPSTVMLVNWETFAQSEEGYQKETFYMVQTQQDLHQ